jgi:hypothetical protein
MGLQLIVLKAPNWLGLGNFHGLFKSSLTNFLCINSVRQSEIMCILYDKLECAIQELTQPSTSSILTYLTC